MENKTVEILKRDIVERKKGEKFWTVQDGKIVCAHIGRNGDLKDIRLPKKIEIDNESNGRSSITYVIAYPPEGIRIDTGRWVAKDFQTKVEPLMDGVQEQVIESCVVILETGVSVRLITEQYLQKTEAVRQAESIHRLEQFKQVETERLAEKVRLFGENFVAWKESRFQEPLKGLSSRTRGRAQRTSGEKEAACAVVEDWLSVETLPGQGEYLFLTKLVEELGGKEKVLFMVRTALEVEGNNEAKKMISLEQLDEIFEILGKFNDQYLPSKNLASGDIQRCFFQEQDGTIHSKYIRLDDRCLSFLKKIGVSVLNLKIFEQTKGKSGVVLGGTPKLENVVKAAFESNILGAISKAKRDRFDGLDLSGINVDEIKLHFEARDVVGPIALDLRYATPIKSIVERLCKNSTFRSEQILDLARSTFDAAQIAYFVENGISGIALNPQCTVEQLEILSRHPETDKFHLLCAPSATEEQCRQWAEDFNGVVRKNSSIYRQALRKEARVVLQQKSLEKAGWERKYLNSISVDMTSAKSISEGTKLCTGEVPREIFGDNIALNEDISHDVVRLNIYYQDGIIYGLVMNLYDHVFGKVETLPNWVLDAFEREHAKKIEEKKQELAALESVQQILVSALK
jgi:hypothetical protein